MNHQIVRILEADEAGGIVAELARREFSNGKLTAEGQARDVKNNVQLRPEAESNEMEKLVIAGFQRSEDFQVFTFPKRLSRPIFSRYDPGMSYGPHVDAAIMGGFAGIRTDLSVTLFLSPPGTYDGGELVVEQGSGRQEIKLNAGEAFVYSSDTVHHVSPVTRGSRYAAICWVQSAVRDERLRSILHDLNLTGKNELAIQNAELALLLSKTYQNLLRYAVEL